jgi:predicted GNAT superfamily acetyltransferase
MADEIRIRLAQGRSDVEACIALQRAVWGLSDLEITPALDLVTAIHAGAILEIAQAESGDAVGFAYAIPALRGGSFHFHSAMVAVLPEYQKQGLGVALKWAARDEALERGASLITWTFDPLQARNANISLRRLGGQATELLEDVYWVTSPTDYGRSAARLFVRWDLGSERVARLLREGEPPRSIPAPALPRINDVKWQAGWPVSSEPRLDLEAPELLLEVPPEWDVIAEAAPRVAEDWQGKVRRALAAYMGRGYGAADFAPTEEGGRRRPLYVLRKLK